MSKEVRIDVEGFTFTWDAEKAVSNLKKHGVSFTEALEVVFDAYYTAEDASVENEERYGIVGYSHKGKLLYVVVADLEESTYRIISARPATSKERERYEEDNLA
jgi:uncharacterized DUF497 family protein